MEIANWRDPALTLIESAWFVFQVSFSFPQETVFGISGSEIQAIFPAWTFGGIPCCEWQLSFSCYCGF